MQINEPGEYIIKKKSRKKYKQAKRRILAHTGTHKD